MIETFNNIDKKKRIGIITQPLGNNYGCVLQNYALQKVLKEKGYEPITIDYFPFKSYWRVFLSFALNFFLLFSKKRRTFKECLPVKRNKYITEFINKRIDKTETIKGYSSAIISDYNLFSVIVGSDQVWRPAYNDGVLYDMFLDFAKDLSLIRIAYAASFGVDTNEYRECDRAYCENLLHLFDAVSVREPSGVVLCKQLFNIDAISVLDPTLLLERKYYLDLFNTNSIEKEDFILTYILNPSPDKDKAIKELSDNKMMKIVQVDLSNDLKFSVEDWLNMFNSANYVVTDSFHGTVFSIIFHKKFCVLDNVNRGSTRIRSVLMSLGLEELLLSHASNMDEILNFNVNWDNVDIKLGKMRQSSLDFLYKSLSDFSI